MRIWLVLAFVAAILVVLIVPPMLSVSRYQSQITQLMSASLGRPVRLSSVEMRLLPRPGFLLNDLTVSDDPAFGAEPVLHATTVTASIRLLSLWRGRLEIGSITVDEASLNLIHSDSKGWNVDTLFRTATSQNQTTGISKRAVSLPSLEATNSRINIKNGVEKLPFSLLNSKIAFSQENPNEWRIQLRGQPVRTDVSMEQADTGTVRMTATLHRNAQMRQMPLHIDLEWKEAQLGQLTRLILGADAGWRGNLEGELHLDGTAESAQVTSQLRATGVHRAEFAPASPMDFDAKCGFVYHFSIRSVDHLACESPLGNGRIRITGNLPHENEQQRLSVELDRIPVAVGLDALRTVRSGFAPGLVAGGTVSGKVDYDTTTAEEKPTPTKASAASSGKNASAKSHPAIQNPLTGGFTVDGLKLSGDGLSEPIQIAKLVLLPASLSPQAPQQPAKSSTPTPTLPPALTATLAFPAGGSGPLTMTSRLAISGYQLTVHGQASVVKVRELAHVAGLKNASLLDNLAGEPVTIDLSAAGPWMPAEKVPFSNTPPADASTGTSANSLAHPAATETSNAFPVADRLSGTITLHNANWKADYLANHVQITQATLHLEDGEDRWDPVVFSYGPVKGTALLSLPVDCEAPRSCTPTFQVQLGSVDSSVLQAAVLGAQVKGTLLSTLIDRLDRLRPATVPVWPHMEGTVKADSLLLGPVTLQKATASVRILDDSAEITSLDAALLGGRVSGSGSLHLPATRQDKPSYTFEGRFEKLTPQTVGPLISQHWSGGVFDAQGRVELSGFTEKDLAASAKGTMHFDWQHGVVSGAAGLVPAALARFDRWTADAEIANGTLTLKQNQVKRGAQSSSVEAKAVLGAGAKASFVTTKETKTPAKR
jgi:hypothetical protein